jgi:hypothetical protein
VHVEDPETPDEVVWSVSVDTLALPVTPDRPADG